MNMRQVSVKQSQFPRGRPSARTGMHVRAAGQAGCTNKANLAPHRPEKAPAVDRGCAWRRGPSRQTKPISGFGPIRPIRNPPHARYTPFHLFQSFALVGPFVNGYNDIFGWSRRTRDGGPKREEEHLGTRVEQSLRNEVTTWNLSRIPVRFRLPVSRCPAKPFRGVAGATAPSGTFCPVCSSRPAGWVRRKPGSSCGTRRAIGWTSWPCIRNWQTPRSHRPG